MMNCRTNGYAALRGERRSVFAQRGKARNRVAAETTGSIRQGQPDRICWGVFHTERNRELAEARCIVAGPEFD